MLFPLGKHGFRKIHSVNITTFNLFVHTYCILSNKARNDFFKRKRKNPLGRKNNPAYLKITSPGFSESHGSKTAATVRTKKTKTIISFQTKTYGNQRNFQIR